MLILFQALIFIGVLYAIYRLAFSWKFLSQAVGATAMILIFVVLPVQIKVMMIVVVFVYGIASFIASENETKDKLA